MKSVSLVVFLVASFLPVSHALADFYVIPAARKARRTVLVSPGATPEASGAALLAAMGGITGASGDNPYLVVVEPGIYDIGGGTLAMIPHVDIQGSGEGVTTIRGNRDSSSYGVVNGASDAELRFLTVENEGGGSYATAIHNPNLASPRITHVKAVASGGSTASRAIFSSRGSPVLTHVTVEAHGGTDNYGVYSWMGTPVLTDVSVHVHDATDDCFGVEITTTEGTVWMTGVTIVVENGADLNRGLYNVSAERIVMKDCVIRTEAGAGAENHGVHSHSADLVELLGCEVSASGGEDTVGVYQNQGLVSVSDTRVSASGASGLGHGLWLVSCSAEMNNLVASGSGGTAGFGLALSASSGSHEIRADRCTFGGTTLGISSDSEFTHFVGASRVEGGCSVMGSWTCTQCYDGSYVALNTSCQ